MRDEVLPALIPTFAEKSLPPQNRGRKISAQRRSLRKQQSAPIDINRHHTLCFQSDSKTGHRQYLQPSTKARGAPSFLALSETWDVQHQHGRGAPFPSKSPTDFWKSSLCPRTHNHCQFRKNSRKHQQNACQAPEALNRFRISNIRVAISYRPSGIRYNSYRKRAKAPAIPGLVL